ncbi:hypothetical protein P0D88_16790 [Paraburkholderia sp. RL18-103-BIB-C]|uniref:hypothetical protein n=1 Tax=Paraburkholderia sp. RL18-103-BIB-C TaxID=3031637 RepID=UPI0038BAF717
MKLGAANQAIVLAFDSSLTADEAVAALKAGQMDRAEQQADSYRMGATSAGATDTNPRFDPKAAAARIIAAGEKASGQIAPVASSNRTAARVTAAGERARGE